MSGDGLGSVVYTGDPSLPGGGTETFVGHWSRDFDLGFQDWAALRKVHVTVTESSGKDATVSCTIQYDDSVGGHSERKGSELSRTGH